ncbi:SDR family NAD(P)-dependent oxidoreductase [Arcicella rosea]|uniref:Nucleoside-diphosphate-sugar epimerase n=1 Tax=Arcicella rosea TaxID=502909 RepID=A0A841EM27_9BACT|nr:SDR family NAD(P)-dependent oxidoreductase [Arcicella rosea]MBB6001818.1 nucleoside-diphosphate-sugar epimerase [Arcicella rosea]
MKISILGCGWLGLPLGKYLVENGHEVKGSTTSEAKLSLLQSVGIQPFLLKFSPAVEGDELAEFLQSEILIICIPPRAGKYGEDYHIQQIQSLIPALKKSSIQSIIYTSSTSVYPDLNREITEDDEVITSSALIKVEELLKALDTQTTILRCGGLMGMERIGAKYFAGKRINTGQIPVNYIHQDDVIGIISTILEKGFWGETFNVVSPEHPVRKEVFLKNCEEYGFEVPIFEEATEAIPFKIISPQKLIEKTGYQFKYANPLDFTYSFL